MGVVEFFELLFYVLLIALWVWAIIDVVRSKFIDSKMKAVWLSFAIFFPVVGSLVYLQMKRFFVIKKPEKLKTDSENN